MTCTRVFHRLFRRALQEGRRDQIAAIHQRADRHHRLQRRDRETMAEGDGHGVQLAPVPRHDRLGAFGQFRAHARELAHLAQKRLVLLDALPHRHARRADVGGIGEDFRHGQRAVLRVIIVDLEAAEGERAARVEARIEIDLAGVERHGDGQRLEGRAHFIDADVHAVDVQSGRAPRSACWDRNRAARPAR